MVIFHSYFYTITRGYILVFRRVEPPTNQISQEGLLILPEGILLVSATKPSKKTTAEVMQMGADAFDIAAGQRRKRSCRHGPFLKKGLRGYAPEIHGYIYICPYIYRYMYMVKYMVLIYGFI